MVETPKKVLVPVGETWLLKVFLPDGQLMVTLEPRGDALEASDLAVTRLDFSPQGSPLKWLTEANLDDLVADARWQAEQIVSHPDYQAVRWTHRTRRGKPTSDSLLEEVVRLRRSHSVSEIAERLDRSPSQVFRYLKLARERGLIDEKED